MASRSLLPFFVALTAGFATLITPDVIGIEELNRFLLLTFGVSVVVGFLMARFWPGFWWLWPILFALGYPVTVVYDILLDPKSHNLWPIEIALCIPYIITGMVGAAFSRFFLNVRSEQ